MRCKRYPQDNFPPPQCHQRLGPHELALRRRFAKRTATAEGIDVNALREVRELGWSGLRRSEEGTLN
jgi:hypothetical protein